MIPTETANKDVRSVQLHIRDTQTANDGSHVISGTAVVFNQPSEAMPFIEYVSPLAFNNVDFSAVQLLYNHDFSSILARVDAGTLEISVDNKGLNFTATLPDTQLGNDTFTNIQNGNLQGLSFGFTIADDSWGLDKDGNEVHTINQIDQLFEISLTPIPAYQETSVKIERSLQQFRNEERENMAKDTTDKATEPDDSIKGPQGTEGNVQAPADDTYTLSDSQLNQLVEAVLKGIDEKEADTSTDAPSNDNSTEPADDTSTDTRDDEPDDDTADDNSDDDSGDDSSDDSDDDSGDDVEEDAKTTKEEKRENKNMRTVKPNSEKSVFEKYLVTRDMSIADGTTTANNGVAIPHDVLQSIEKPANTNSLSGLANHIQVTAPAGTLPVMASTDVSLATAAELAENPQLAKLALSGVDYKLKTYRGAIPVSQEMLDDAASAANISGLIGDYATQIHDNTLEKDIATALQSATASTITSFDDFKKAYNDTYKYSQRVVVVTKSAFDALDTLKDNEGRYLLQDDISSATGKAILGAPVYIVEDTRLGAKNGDQLAFVGSVHSFVTVADFKDLRVKWSDDYVYGSQLQLIVREDTIVADPDAGKLLTLNFTPASSSK
ncbi:phage major capsid protein [Levilactobacillus brevis]